MNIIVTGGAGFIGSNFLYYMLQKYPNYQFICIDNLTYAGNLQTIKELFSNSNFYFEKEDISNVKAINNIFEKYRPDMVVNFAAESHVDRSIDNPSVFLKTNVIGTSVLLNACVKYGIKRFHQISTDEVYGDLPLDRKDLLFSETNPLRASSPYSASKASADLLVLAYYKTYGLKCTISRCSNNYGKYQFPEKLIPLSVVNILTGKPISIYGDGKNVRDWIYVTDHCRAIDLILHKGKSGEVYNIGGNNEKSNIDVVKTIISQLGKGEIKYVADRKGHDRRYAIDSTKIIKELGFVPKVNFDEGIKNTVKWYIDNQKWWKNILSGEYKKEPLP